MDTADSVTDKPDVDAIAAEAVNSAKVRQPLYSARKKIFPKRAEGKFRQFKWLVMAITLGIYYLTPWLRWDRGPHAPDQAILIDMANRRFYFFFIEIWPQEFFFVAGLLVMAGVGLFLVTSAVGRAWCGYTCPQTVWVDLFLVVERFVEGDRNARMKLDAGPWTASKISKRIVKHAIWLLIAVATGGAWIFYFADAPTLAKNFLTGNAPAIAYMTVAVLAATTYTFGGIMREQICTYMCPWPRIQAAMLDEHSLTVTYNEWRGEPRNRGRKKALAAGQTVGDCVDCNACVAVCPMGIDIRDGLQLECITCALCIDACDAVMDKLNMPRGLISYTTLSTYAHNVNIATENGKHVADPKRVYGPDGKLRPEIWHFRWKVLARPRTLVYLAAWSAIGFALLYALGTRERLEVNVLHDRNPQFVALSDGSIRNGYNVKLLNMIPEPRTILLKLEDLPAGSMTIPELDQLGGDSYAVPVDPDKIRNLKVFVTIPKQYLPKGEVKFRFTAEDKASNERDVYEAVFFVPENR